MNTPKETNVTLSFPNDGNISRVSFTPEGSILFFDRNGEIRKPPNVRRTTTHTRAHKEPKVRTQISLDVNALTLSALDELTEFHEIIVVDTAQSTIPWREAVAFTCAISLRFEKAKGGVMAVANDKATLYEFHNYQGNPERLGLLTVAMDAGPLPGARRLLVNDSDLGLHQQINDRTEPLFERNHLAPGFTLQYAGDTGQEALNSVLRFCDGICRKMRRDIASGLYPPDRLLIHPLVPSVRYRRGHHDGVEIVNPLVKRVPLTPGTTIQLWGRRKNEPSI